MGRSIASEPEEFLPTGESIGVRTRRGGKVGERAGEGGRGLQIETGVGPGNTGDPPVPSGDSPDGTSGALRANADGPCCNAACCRSGRRVADRGGRVARATYCASRKNCCGAVRGLV